MASLMECNETCLEKLVAFATRMLFRRCICGPHKPPTRY